MTQFYARPYDMDANGFYFENTAEYQEKSAALKNTYGNPVEEVELQFIDAETIDAELFKALSVNQTNIVKFMECLDEWDDSEKSYLIIAVGECGYDFDMEKDNPYDFDVTIYQAESMKELAKEFVNEGLFGDIPESIAFYIDYELVARDLAVDHSETSIDGQTVIYRCA